MMANSKLVLVLMMSVAVSMVTSKSLFKRSDVSRVSLENFSSLTIDSL